VLNFPAFFTYFGCGRMLLVLIFDNFGLLLQLELIGIQSAIINSKMLNPLFFLSDIVCIGSFI